jgi:hypothetical protein
MLGHRFGFGPVSRLGVGLLALGISAATSQSVAKADSTPDYPIPHRIIETTCTAEQLLAAARDYEPVYYERYMIDMHNKPPNIQQSTRDKIHWFLSLNTADRRYYSDNMFYNGEYPGGVDPLWAAWPNNMKIFFNNKGVAAHETDHCADYPPSDESVWDWAPNPSPNVPAPYPS